MKFITKLGVTCATIAMMASTMSFASTVSTQTLTSRLVDNYIGADGSSYSTTDAIGGSGYDVNWMTVDKSVNGFLTVIVDSNFISNTSSGYKLGDLFIMDADNYQEAADCSGLTGKVGCNESSSATTYNTVKTTNEWEFAFDLGGGRDTNGRSVSNVSGKLRDIKNSGYVNYRSDLISTGKDGSHRGWQAIMVQNDPNAVGSGNWSTNASSNLLTMTFDIRGTSLMDAAQLALRWQMTCANDIIEVVTNFRTNNTTVVPEPSTMLLMLLAGFGLFASRKKQTIGFKA